ncbi:MAG: GvpL/GvpF family gas vesicle protein [Actinomycetota bacterium]|nr:GvpL/GvpF family gas vesicle protein [Actinomycetota bacterium]
MSGAPNVRHRAETLADPAVGLCVYGVVAAAEDRVPEGLTGIDDAQVQLVELEDIAAVTADVRLDRPAGRRADLVAYSSVLDALSTSGPVVPVRFGSVLPDAQAVVADVLAPQADFFRELLAQLEGRAQFNLRADYDEPTILAEIVASDRTVAALRERTRGLSEEAAYADRVRLGELVAQALEHKREIDTEVLMDAIVPFTVDQRLTPGTGLEQVMSVAVLVDDEQREQFEEQLEALAEVVHERIRLSLVGPVPPYDFVGDA